MCNVYIKKKNSDIKICHLKTQFKKSQLKVWFGVRGVGAAHVVVWVSSTRGSFRF